MQPSILIIEPFKRHGKARALKTLIQKAKNRYKAGRVFKNKKGRDPT
jgi:hypothetical protein